MQRGDTGVLPSVALAREAFVSVGERHFVLAREPIPKKSAKLEAVYGCP